MIAKQIMWLDFFSFPKDWKVGLMFENAENDEGVLLEAKISPRRKLMIENVLPESVAIIAQEYNWHKISKYQKIELQTDGKRYLVNLPEVIKKADIPYQQLSDYMLRKVWSQPISFYEESMCKIGKETADHLLWEQKDGSYVTIWERVHYAFYPGYVYVGKKSLEHLRIRNIDWDDEAILYAMSVMRRDDISEKTGIEDDLKVIIEKCVETDSRFLIGFENMGISFKSMAYSPICEIRINYWYDEESTSERKYKRMTFESTNKDSILKLIFRFLKCECIQDLQTVVDLKNKIAMLGKW